MDAQNQIRKLNSISALLADLKEVPSTHLTLTAMQVADYLSRIDTAIKQIAYLKEYIMNNVESKGPPF